MRTETCASAGCENRTLAHWTTCWTHYRDGMNVADAERIEQNRRKAETAEIYRTRVVTWTGDLSAPWKCDRCGRSFSDYAAADEHAASEIAGAR